MSDAEVQPERVETAESEQTPPEPERVEMADPKQLIISVCGGLNWDLIMVASQIPISGECLNADEFAEFPGGKGGNAAIALHRLAHMKPTEEPAFATVDNLIMSSNSNDSTNAGVPPAGPEPRTAFGEQLPKVAVRMIGAIGTHMSDNRRGIRMKSWLQYNWIDVSLIKEIPDIRSATAFGMVEADTGANRALISPGANHLPIAKDFMDVGSLGSPKPDLIVIELELNRKTVSRIIRLAKDSGIEVVFNPAPANVLPVEIYNGISHLIVNETEAAIMQGEDSEKYVNGCDDWNTVTNYFLNLGVKNVVVTLEERGAFFSMAEGKGFHVPAVSVPQEKILDTAGAGDTFVGAYAIEWMRQKHTRSDWDPERAVRNANRAAAMIIQKVGCQEAIPWASDFEEVAAAADTTTRVEEV